MKRIIIIFILVFSLFFSVYADNTDWSKDYYNELTEWWLSPQEASKISWYTPEDDTITWTTGCTYDENGDLSSFLNGCKPKTVVWWWNMQIEGWFKDKINNWIANIALVLWIWAVWALVYAALLLQFANGEDEKIKKSKDIIKWTMIGFILLISASGVIYVVINVMFWLWWE